MLREKLNILFFVLIFVSCQSEIIENKVETNSLYSKSSSQKVNALLVELPSVTTSNVTNISFRNTTCGGNVVSEGGATVIARGVCWSQNPIPNVETSDKTVNGTGTGLFTTTLTGTLTPFCTYYICAYATNSAGTAYGNIIMFKTPTTATVVTNDLSDISSNNAICGGNVTTDGGSNVIARGVCYNTSPNPTILNYKTTDGTGVGLFTSQLSLLRSSTTYYIRAYATNTALGTSYGSQKTFTTASSPTVQDIDGNTYHTVKIGSQTWMVENLKTTKYNDGTLISNVTDASTWYNLQVGKKGAYCSFDNNTTYSSLYGYLYNGYAVKTGKLCPFGWHVPTDVELTTLINYLGGATIAGGVLKESGTVNWLSPNTGATNAANFYALPGGYRFDTGGFHDIRHCCIFWSSTIDPAINTNLWKIYLINDAATIIMNSSIMQYGFSVRCIKNVL